MGLRSLPISFAAVGLAILVSGSAQAVDGLRCGNRLAQGGETRDAIRKKCGEPADIATQTLLRRPSIIRYGVIYYGNELVEVPVEIWTYNFGPNKFMRRLRFVDGLLEEVETLGYGYH